MKSGNSTTKGAAEAEPLLIEGLEGMSVPSNNVMTLRCNRMRWSAPSHSTRRGASPSHGKVTTGRPPIRVPNSKRGGPRPSPRPTRFPEVDMKAIPESPAKQVFGEALDKPPPERGVFVETALRQRRGPGGVHPWVVSQRSVGEPGFPFFRHSLFLLRYSTAA